MRLLNVPEVCGSCWPGTRKPQGRTLKWRATQPAQVVQFGYAVVLAKR